MSLFKWTIVHWFNKKKKKKHTCCWVSSSCTWQMLVAASVSPPLLSLLFQLAIWCLLECMYWWLGSFQPFSWLVNTCLTSGGIRLWLAFLNPYDLWIPRYLQLICITAILPSGNSNPSVWAHLFYPNEIRMSSVDPGEMDSSWDIASPW